MTHLTRNKRGAGCEPWCNRLWFRRDDKMRKRLANDSDAKTFHEQRGLIAVQFDTL